VLAESCCSKFNEPVTSLQDMEDKGNSALELLSQSVRSVPRVSSFSGESDDLSKPADLKLLATRIVREKHEHCLNVVRTK